MKIIISIFLVIVVTLSCLSFISSVSYKLIIQNRGEIGAVVNQLAGKTTPRESQPGEPEKTEWEEKRYTYCDIFYNFVPQKLLVTLDKSISIPHRIPDFSFFNGVEVVDIQDLDYWIDSENPGENYRQTLSIKLSDKYKTKFATLQAMYILESVEGIYSVQPNFIYGYDNISYED